MAQTTAPDYSWVLMLGLYDPISAFAAPALWSKSAKLGSFHRQGKGKGAWSICGMV
ncbi:hypothetical protein RCCS2_08754 [Roseobacter sp. CCS2]|nr:hypothetical protein RCCS2_08754 [Roseobacter sp. CCS2]